MRWLVSMTTRPRLLCLALLSLILLCHSVDAISQHKFSQQRLRTQSQQQQHTPSSSSSSPLSLLEEASGATESNEIIQSLKHLLEEKKASGELARAKLESAAQHTVAVEAALQAKRAELASHNEMLQRFEQCLQQGPVEKRAEKKEALLQQSETALIEARAKVESRDAMLAKEQEELEMEKDELAAQEKEMSTKETDLKSRETHLASQQSLLEQQASEIDAREKSYAARLAKDVETAVAEKLALIQENMERKAEDKLRAVREAMSEQARSMLREQQTSLLEHKASHIASRHEMKDLTSPYAEQDELQQKEQMENEDGTVTSEEPALIETSAFAPTTSSSVPAPTTNSSLSGWARKLVLHCSLYDSCDKCSGDGRCGWCSSGGGKCLPLDVNANMRQGQSVDGLTSGQCTSEEWQSSVASRLTLLSLNVFASERGNSTRRFASIIQLIKKSGADIVALQEVERWFVHALQAHSWVKLNYHLTEYGPGQAPGGLFILSRYPIAEINYYENIQPGQVEVTTRARVLVAKLGVKSQAVYVATTVLDYRSSENRVSSLEFIFRTLKPYHHVFLLGDFNFDEGSKLETTAVPQSYLDLWPSLVQDGRPGYTWDPRSNWFAASSDPQSRSSRIDRIYLRSNQWMPRTIHLVGCSVSDPLCGAKNLDVKKGVTLIDANKLNPALILAAPTNEADRAKLATSQGGLDSGRKPQVFLEEGVRVLVQKALREEEALESGDYHESEEEAELAAELEEEDGEQQSIFLESSTRLNTQLRAPKPTFEPDFVPSNHYGLLVQATQFAPKCPVPEE